MNLPDMATLISIVRAACAEILVPGYGKVQRRLKADNSVITEVDLAMQARLQKILHEHWPEFRFLGEEMSADEHKALLHEPGNGVWLVDPLDGTRNFAAGIPFFTVSVALYAEGGLQLGLVYDPMRDEMFSAIKGQGAYLNGESLPTTPAPKELSDAIAVVDFKRLSPKLVSALASKPPYSSQRSFGSVALDWCWLASHRFHVYLHGSQNIWDYAAGCLILTEANGFACTFENEPVFKAIAEPRSAIAAYDSRLFSNWQAYIFRYA